MTTQQVETATVIGTIDTGGGGNATVVITARDMDNSPKTKERGCHGCLDCRTSGRCYP